MKKLFNLCILLSFFSNGALAGEIFKIDPEHSYVLYQIQHFGFSTQTGKWQAEGTLDLDKKNPQNSKVNVTIPIANIDTGNTTLDKHLKGKLFFDVEQYPTATFVSNKVDVKGKDKAIVHGILTLHGVSKPVALNVTLNKEGMSPITDKETVGLSAHTEIKRSDFGIKTLSPGLSDDVKLTIELEANQEKAMSSTMFSS